MNVAKIFGRTSVMAIGVGVALLAIAPTANAFALRSSQVSFSQATLQGYFNSIDGGISTLTGQLDAQLFATSVSGNADFTLLVKLTAYAGQNAIGIYNAYDVSGTPTTYQLFPAAAAAGSHVDCSFKSTGSLIVTLFDQNGAYQGQTTYTGVDRAHFCFYLQNNSGTYYQQDGRNGNKPQALTYQGTGANGLDLFMAFQDTPYNMLSSTFTGAVLDLQSIVPTPVHNTSWGQLKAQYR